MLLKIAFRNILRQKRRSFFTILSIAVGFAFASIMIAWRMGSFNLVIDKFTRAYLGHIQIHADDYLDKPSLYKNISDYKSLGEKIMSVEGVESLAPRMLAAGLGTVGEKSTAIQITGIDPALENNATGFQNKIESGENLPEKPSHKVILGKGLMQNLDAEIGDEFVVVSQAADGSIANDMYEIIGVVVTGNEYSDRIGVYMHLADAQELMVLENRIHEIVVITNDIRKVDKYAARIEEKLANPALEILPWKKVNESFYKMIKAKEQAQSIMHIVIMIIVAIGVLNTVLMSVLERIREFGVLKAVGTRASQIFRMIITEAFILCLVGILIGIAIGLAVNYPMSLHGIKVFDSMDIGGVQFDTLKSEVNARSIYEPAIIVFLTSLIVSIYPALKAARTRPAKAMRFH